MEIQVARNILDGNDAIARQNRELFSQKGVFVLNVMSSPGAGKTTLLEKTLSYLVPEINSAVIVGDICTSNDAKRLARSGAPVVQINTDAYGGNCHLTAQFIENAATDLVLDAVDLLIVENVGNLVCPAEFDVGEDARLVVLSVTEGEDKPVKYPVMFRKCHVAVINKIDLLPYVDCSLGSIKEESLKINPDLVIFEVSCKTGEGLDDWYDWLRRKRKRGGKAVE